MYYCVAIPWQVVEWEEARKKCNDECRLSVSILVAMNCLSAMHRNLGRMRAANRVMDAALALHKETFLKQPGSTAGEPGGLLHAGWGGGEDTSELPPATPVREGRQDCMLAARSASMAFESASPRSS